MSFSVEEFDFYEFDYFRLDAATRRLTDSRDESLVSLSPKTFDLLLLLVRNKNSLVTKEMIFEQIWGERIVEDNNLTVRVCELRKALGERRDGAKLIETKTGSGYRFVARVRSGIKLPPHLKTPVEASDSLAVLPFVNESRREELEYLADGVTESVINNLAQLPQLKVISRNTAFRFKGDKADLPQIGDRLGVRAILAGRILQVGKDLVLNVELIDCADNSQIWGARFRYQSSDIFETQEAIAREVVARLRLKLTESERGLLAKRYTENTEVYHLYLKGRYFWNQRSVVAVNRAIEYFRQAVEIDSSYALAHSGLSDCYHFLFVTGASDPQEVLEKSEVAAIRSLEIDDSLAEARVSLANTRVSCHRDWASAEREFLKSIELNPQYVPGRYYYANLLIINERFDEALAQMDFARSLDPLSPIVIKAHGRTLLYARQYDEAIEKCREAFELLPNYTLVSSIIGLAYIGKGDYDKALPELEKILQFTSGNYKLPESENLETFSEFQKRIFSLEADLETIAHIGYIYAVTGKPAEAREILDGLKYLYSHKSRYVEPHTIAFACLGLGDKDQAMEWLEKAYAEQAWILNYAKVYFLLDSLRSDERFQTLLQRLGFNR